MQIVGIAPPIREELLDRGAGRAPVSARSAGHLPREHAPACEARARCETNGQRIETCDREYRVCRILRLPVARRSPDDADVP